MKTILKIVGLSFLMLFAVSQAIIAQVVLSDNDSRKLTEKTFLLTDREIYCVNEIIHYSVINLSSDELRKSDWSNVIYVELVAPDGEVFARRKSIYNQDGASGWLKIPSGTLSGNYYLRAYSRWMRNYMADGYFYKMITIINPSRPELLVPELKDTINLLHQKIATYNEQIKIETEVDAFGKRSEVEVNIEVADPQFFNKRFILSVIPEGTGEPVFYYYDEHQNLEFSDRFIPETRGLSISGLVVNQADSLPLPYTLVGLTVFSEKSEIRNNLTDEKGRFFFDLSGLTGDYELFLSAKPSGDKKPQILVDNDFSTSHIKLPSIPLDLSKEKMEIYRKISVTSQLHDLFTNQKVVEEPKTFSSDSVFYGNVDFVLKLADYIALPTIKAYFYELVPQVKLIHDGKQSKFKVLGSFNELALYEPLVMIDMVPVFDTDKILELKPEKIDRIEVLATPYVRGNIVFGGIVSLFSKKGDLAGIDLPSAGRFINYSMFGSEISENPTPLNSSRIPTVKNCLYWNAAIFLDNSAKANVRFYTGDNAGKFQIMLKSIDKDGKLYYSSKMITVK
jgi:hypothetical protein